MAEKTQIEWTSYKGNPGSTWNVFTGCSKVSQGCKYCYAERWAKRGMGQFAKDPGRKFNDIRFHQDKLTDPLNWKRPRMIFVCSMSDLFHESLEFTTIDMIFEVMQSAAQHIFLILTKRPERMLEYYRRMTNAINNSHIWVGTSVEDQKTFDDRWEILKQVPAYIRFLSIEPLLGSVDVTNAIYTNNPVDWIIAGGESGPKARPSHPDWFRSIRDICIEYEVPFFFKQWGEWINRSNMIDKSYSEQSGIYVNDFGNEIVYKIGKRKAGRQLDGKYWDQFPDDARVHFTHHPVK